MAILYSYPLSPLINADDLIPGTVEDSKTTVNWKVSTLATYISNTQNVSTNRIPKYDGSKFVNSPFLVSNATTVKTEADIWFPTRGIKDTNNNIGITGQVLSSFNGSLKWIAPGGGYFLDVPAGTTNVTLNDATGLSTDVELSATGNISLTRIDANNIQIGSTPINKATSTVLGTVKLNSDTVQNINAQIISADLNRTYGLQFNSQDQGVINVPWVDTQYAVFTGATAGSDGSTGLVPQPLQGEELKFLRADATWADNPGITYTLTGVTVNTTDFNINLNPSPGTTESVTLKPGTNVTLTGGTNEVTINAVDQFDGTVTSITPAADSGTGTAITTVGTLTFTGSGDITTSVTGDTVTINGSNTTYILGKAAGSTDLILKADGTAQDTITFSGTTNQVAITGTAADAYVFGLPDDVTVEGELTSIGQFRSLSSAQAIFSGQVTVPIAPSVSTDSASKGYVDGLVSGGLTFRGTFRADTGEIVSGVNSGSFLYNCPGGAGTRIAVSIGDYYIVATAGGQFYCSGTNLDIGDSIIATASAVADASVVTGWSIVQSDEGVTDFSSTAGTFVDVTANANAVGSVDIGTVDLSASGLGGSVADREVQFLRGDNTWATPAYVSYSAMTSSVLGLGKLFDDTEQTVGATAVSAITARTYGVQMNSSDQLVVNVPWTDTQNAFQTITGTGSDNTDSGILLSDSGGTVKILGDGTFITAAQTGNTITLTGTAGSDTTYTYTSAQSTNDVDLILTDSNAATNIVKLVKGSNITLTDSSNSVTIAAQNDNDNDFLTGLAFNTGDGVLTATVQNQSNVTVDLDGRYALSSGSVSGGGTTQKVVKFTNTSTTAATIGDGPITFSSDVSIFADELEMPSYIRHTGDTNTYIGFSGNDTIDLSTDSNVAMRIASSGQIQFDRSGQPPITNSLYGNIVLGSDAVTNFQRIRYDVGTTAYWGLTRLNSGNFAITGGSTWNDHAFSLEYSTQNVGVGMSSSVFPGKFNVAANSGLTTTSVGDGIFVGPEQGNSAVGSNWAYSNSGATYTDFCSRYDSSSSFLRFIMKASATPVYAMTIRGSGSVGIGTESPVSKLTVSGPSAAASNTNTNAIVDIVGSSTAHLLMGTAAVSPYGAWINSDATGQPLVLQGPGGNVGIGTSSPETSLGIGNYTDSEEVITIATSQNGTGRINFYDNNNTEGGSMRVVGESGGSKMYFTNRWNTDSDRVVFDLKNGKVGMGTNLPQGKLDVQYDMAVDTGSVTGFSSGTTRYGNINFSGVAAQGQGQNATTMQGITWSVNNYGGTTDYGNQAQLVVGNNGDVGTFMGFFTSNNYGAAPVEKMRITSDGNVSMQKGTYAGQDLAISTNNLEISGDNSNGTRVGLRNFGSASSIVLFENSNVPPGFAGYSRTGTTYMALNTSGQFNIGGTSGTGAEKNAINMDFSDGSLAFSQYGSGNITGTAAYSLGVDTSGNVIETAGGGGLTPAVQEQTFTFSRTQLNAGFGGSGLTLIPAQGSGKFVIVQGSWWYTTGTGTSTGANLNLEARQENQIAGTQTVTKIVGLQFNYMTSQNGGNGMFFRDVPISGLRPYLPNKPTTFHRTSGNQLPSQFTELKLKLQWRVFDSSNI